MLLSVILIPSIGFGLSTTDSGANALAGTNALSAIGFRPLSELELPPPANDNPCNAQPLTVNTSCTFTPYTTQLATNTTGVPAPGCANYNGADVWFTATVPANGQIAIDTQTGAITDGGMAVYAGTCTSLALLQCDDDGSVNGLMPALSLIGLTPGSTIFIRFWSFGGSPNGTFSICVKSIAPCNPANQNSSCNLADPFCAGATTNLCNTTNVPSLGSGGIYGCLGSTPNPAFYFMNVGTSGPLNLQISQTSNAGTPIDVDYVAWGPFASQAAMCSGLTAGNIVGCSFSISAVENLSIPGAVAGQWYMLLITNFSNVAGTIQIEQTNASATGAGSTNCNILTLSPGTCTSGNYTLSGTLIAPGPPGSGTLTISTSCGGSTVVNAPFTSPIPFSIPNLCGNGLSCTVTATFSATGAPAIPTASYTAPSCNSITATPSACAAGIFNVTGNVTFSCPPATGTLTVTSSCGGSQVFTAPFTSPRSYSLTGLCATGASCTVSAVFSAAGAPVIPSQTFTAPANCNTHTVTPGACSGGSYPLSGTLNFGCAPTTGTLTISTSCGGSIVLNAPFTSPLNYTIPGLTGAAGSCTVTAVFSAAGAPFIPNATYTAPSCCAANAGTTTVTVTGGTQTTSGGITTVNLCPGGSFTSNINNNFTLPPIGCVTCTAGMMFGIYQFPGPTTNDPDTDPNWTGYYWTGQNFPGGNTTGVNFNYSTCNEILNLPSIPGFGTLSNNQFVLVPITADAVNLPNHDNNNDGCYAIGIPIRVRMFSPITITPTRNCNGSVSFTLTGGSPAIVGGNYSITKNSIPGTLSSTSIGLNGTVVISGLVSGDTWSITASTTEGCPVTISGTYSGSPIVSIAPSSPSICVGQSVNLTGTVNSNVLGFNTDYRTNTCQRIVDAGIGNNNNGPAVVSGNWAISDINVSGFCGNTWQTGDPLSVCLNIVHQWDDDLNIWLRAPNGVYVKLSDDNGGGGDNYTNTCFSTSAATNITAAAPPFTGSFLPEPGNFNALNGTPINGTWSLYVADDGAFIAGTLLNWSITFTNSSAFTFTWSPALGLSSTTVLNPTATPTSTTAYTLSATNSCGCVTNSTVTVNVNTPSPITITYPGSPYCGNLSVAQSVNQAGPAGGTYTSSPSGLNINSSSGAVTPSLSTPGTYTVTYTMPASGGCPSYSTTTTVLISPPLTVYVSGTNPTCSSSCDGSAFASVSGGTGPFSYSWSGTAATTAFADNLCVGSYTATITDANGCAASSSAAAPAGCFEIESILVDACGSDEQNGEMVFFQVGPTPLSTGTINVTWPNASMVWQGLCPPNLAFISSVNAGITGGGSLVPAPNPIPAGANVVLITSSAPSVSQTLFTNLSTTLYVLFQCPPVLAQGHFGNFGTGLPTARTLTMNIGGCNDQVTYNTNLLTDSPTSSGNGASVYFTANGTASYSNNGCVVPYNTPSASVTLAADPLVVSISGSPTTICSGTPVNLTASGATSYTWSPTTALLPTTGAVVTANPTATITYTVTGTTGPCSDTENITLNVVAPPNAGTAGSTTLCNSGSPMNLFGILGGSPSSSGSWTGASVLSGGHLGTFNPAIALPGTYTYTVTATPCPAASATVAVAISAATSAGSNGSISVCSNGSALDLFSLLGGSPAATGTWTGPSALTGGSLGTYNPAVNASGVYTYTVTGTSPCPTTSATVNVTNSPAPNAGSNGSINLCATGSPVNLFSSLGGTPSTSGSWSGPSSLAGGHLGIYNPSTGSPGTYTYTVSGTLPCTSAQTTVVVNVGSSPNATIAYPGPYCSTLAGIQLPVITGSLGGSFSSSPSGLLINASTGGINPVTSTPNTYSVTYSIPAANGCAAFQTTTSVNITAAPSVPTLTPISPCANTALTLTAGNGEMYEFFVNGVTQGPSSAASTFSTTGLPAGTVICVQNTPANPFIMNGLINEPQWGAALATSAGGPATSGFGGNNRIDGLFMKNFKGILYGAIAGNENDGFDQANNNWILLFIDSRPGGFNNLSSWTNRSNAPANTSGVSNLGLYQGVVFDAGFEPDYVLTMNQANTEAYFDLYDMQANVNTYLGSNLANPTQFGFVGNAATGDLTRGFEFSFPLSLLGSPSTNISLFAMMVNDPNPADQTFLSNQFLTRANNGDGNYGAGFTDFNSAAPNPVSFFLSADCFQETCVTVVPPITPNFSAIAPICNGATVPVLPLTSTNGVSGTWAPAVSNTASGTYTFTPNTGQCATTQTLNITVQPPITLTPVFHN
jgi:subtilisin-like proprotein convertase family protein